MRPVALALVLALIALSCGAPADPAGSAGAAPRDDAFLSIPLTDVRSGERFTLGGFPGKVTFFLAMAVW